MGKTKKLMPYLVGVVALVIVLNIIQLRDTTKVEAEEKYVATMQLINGDWVVCENNQFNYNYTGMACNEYGWWYYQNGRLDWNYTGMACNEYGWWYYQNGRLDWNYTGMACNEYGWWYYQDGRLDWNYTGMACNEYGWWYYQDGRLDWNYTGVGYNWYGTWIYQNGRINFDANGMVYINGEWRFAENGRLINYTGMVENEFGWWYYRDGIIDWGYTGMALNENGWWYFNNGRIDYDYTGMALNEYGWWYFSDGKLDLNYTGIGTNEYGQWYFRNGQIDFSYTGKITIEFADYNVVGGRVVSKVNNLAEYSWGESVEKMNYDSDIVFFGDSLTADSDFASYFSDVYSGKIIELGLSGDTVFGIRSRTDMVKNVTPEKIFVMVGINQLRDDNLEGVLNDYSILLDTLKSDNPDAQIYVQSVLPVSDEIATERVSNPNIKMFNSVLKEAATSKGCVFIDLNPLFTDEDGAMKPEYTIDGLHLNASGYSVWGEAIREFVLE